MWLEWEKIMNRSFKDETETLIVDKMGANTAL